MARGRRRRGHRGIFCFSRHAQFVTADFVWRRACAGGALPAYIFGLRQGKPPGYDRDVFERVFTGNGFAPDENRLPHPLAKDQP